MTTKSAQTIYELVQGRKNAALAFFRVKKLCSQSVKSLSEVFPSLVISFTLPSHADAAVAYCSVFAVNCCNKKSREGISFTAYTNNNTATGDRQPSVNGISLSFFVCVWRNSMLFRSLFSQYPDIPIL